VNPGRRTEISAGLPAGFAPPAPLLLVSSPMCWDARGQCIDPDLLRLRLRDLPPGGAAVLSDIPDVLPSLERALAIPGVVGALAVGCGSVDLWLAPAIERPLLARLAPVGVGVVRRSSETSLACLVLSTPQEAQAAWLAIQSVSEVAT
jgi:hypothetical protein